MTRRIIIDVSKKKLLTESSLARFAAQIKDILRNILSLEAYRAIIREEDEEQEKFVIKGSKKDVMAFADTLDKEKQYAKDYIEHGLGSTQLSDTKLELEKSINNFEKTTGIKWPVG
jgi:Sec7-like guanine-nucleotide exchange factor